MTAPKEHYLLGALCIVLSELMFASMGAAVKAAAATLPNEMIVFGRNFIGLLLMLPLLKAGTASLKTDVLSLHILRATVGVAAMYCFFYALGNMPLANGVLLKMTTPIFMPLIAWYWLKEFAPRLALLAVPIGLLGVVFILRPDAEGVNWVAIVGLAGGALAAWAKVTVRCLTRTEPVSRIVFYFSVLATLVAAVPLLFAWQTPTFEELQLLFLIAVCGVSGQFLLTKGYGAAPAARVGPFTYVSVIFAATYGYLFWGETLDLWFMVGAGLIVFSGLLALYGKQPIKTSV